MTDASDEKSDKKKPDPRVRTWDYVEGILVGAELEALAKEPRDKRQDALRQAGIEPGRGRAKAALAAARAAVDAQARAPAAGGASPQAAGPAAKVIDLGAARQRRRPAPWTWIVAAAAVAVLAVGLTQSAAIVAYFTPTPTSTTSPTSPIPTSPPQPSRQELAALWRDRAWRDCQMHYYGECLDESRMAQELDPDGQSHHALDIAMSLNTWVVDRARKKDFLAKPGLGPGEKALPPRR